MPKVGVLPIKHICWLCCCLLWSLAAPVHAVENLVFEQISDRDGLSHNTVRCLMQDREGFIWAGTVNGLNRFNGREFSVMLPQYGDFATIADNRIRTVVQDKHDYIWVYTTANIVCCYDTRLEKFIDYAPDNHEKSFSKIRIFSNDDVWLWGSEGGCCRIRHLKDGTLQAFSYAESEIGSNDIAFVYEDMLDRIWIGAKEGGLYRMEQEKPLLVSTETWNCVNEVNGTLFFFNSNQIAEYREGTLRTVVKHASSLYPNSTMSLNNGVVLISTSDKVVAFDAIRKHMLPAEPFFGGRVLRNSVLWTDNQQHKWVFNNSGTLWMHTSDNRFIGYDLIPPQILSTITNERYSIYKDSRGITWITTYGNGLFALYPEDKQIRHYTSENSDLISDYLLCIIEDRSGEMWVGTEYSGLCKVSVNNHPVKVLLPSKDNLAHSYANSVRLLYETKVGEYWIGTRDGYLYRYDQSFTKIQTHKFENDIPYSMIEDGKGRLWLGVRKQGLMVSTDRGQHFKLVKMPETVYSVFDMIIDTKNRLWLATFHKGLFVADLNTEDVQFKGITFASYNQNYVRAIHQDRHGLIWTGSNEGINVFDPDELLADNSHYYNFRFDVKNNQSLKNNGVKAILEDRKGRLWFGTAGGGLNLLVRKDPIETSVFKHYTARNGLSNEVIQAIEEDRFGHIWVSTESGSGISRFYPETELFENFVVSNATYTGLFNENTSWKAKDGRLMFGGYTGLQIFDPAQMKLNDYAPKVVMSGLKINGMNVQPKGEDSPLQESITRTPKLTLKHNQNSFNLEFAMLNYFQPANNQYTYYLEGYERDWNTITRHNVASYRNVPAGKYTFKVKGCSSLGVWTEEETVLRIIVKPPFWQSTLAYVLYVILLLIAGYFAIRIVIKIARLNTAITVEKQLTEYKLRFFTNISHEFRTPLTIIRGSIDGLSKLEPQTDTSRNLINQLAKSSSRLLRLVDQLLEFRKLQNNQLELKVEPTEVVGFTKDIYQTFKVLAEKKTIDFRFVSALPACDVLIDRGVWDKITYNFLSNAMKHTPNSGIIELKLDISTTNDQLRVSVSDSGPGVPENKQSDLFKRFAQLNSTVSGTGIGLHLSAELARLHKGEVGYATSSFGGALFYATIPLAASNYDTFEQTDGPTDHSFLKPTDTEVLQSVESEPSNEEVPVLKHKLLVIEDDSDVQDFLRVSLSEMFQVFVAKDGEEGLEIANREQPTMIVCDVMMPGITGFEVTRQLKGNFLTSHIPVILLTAHASEAHKLEGVQAGADAYITKPFSIDYLKARIDQLIEQRELLQKKFSQVSGVSAYQIEFTDKDMAFIEKMNEAIMTNLTNAEFSVDTLAELAGIGRTSFFKKMKGITGKSPNEYINIIRMKKAAELLITTDLNIAEISYSVGVEDPSYFTRHFKSQFGKTPLQFRKQQG